MGFLSDTISRVFGGDDDGPSGPSAPSLSEKGLEVQRLLFSRLENALAGRGLTPEITAKAKSDILREIEKQRGISLANLPSQLGRVIRKEDIGPQQFARGNVKRVAARATEATKRAFEFLPEEDIQTGINLSLGAVGKEQNVANRLASAFNQQQFQLSQIPSFLEAVAGGAGQLGGTAIDAFANREPTTTVNGRQIPIQPSGTFAQLPGGPVNFGRNFIGDDPFFAN